MNNYHKGQEAKEIKSQTSQTRFKSFYPELYFNLNMQSLLELLWLHAYRKIPKISPSTYKPLQI